MYFNVSMSVMYFNVSMSVMYVLQVIHVMFVMYIKYVIDVIIYVMRAIDAIVMYSNVYNVCAPCNVRNTFNARNTSSVR